VAFLSGPSEAQNLEAAQLILDAMVKETGPQSRRTRLEAARLLAMLPDRFDQQLRQLLEDPDIEVARHAVRAVGVLRKRRFVPRLLDRLAEPQLIPANTAALAKFGDQIVGTLRDHLADSTLPTGVRRGIPGVLVEIGTQAAEHALAENLLEGDTTLRFRIISALNKIHKDHPELEFNRQMIETVLAAEILGHYRSYQILGTLGGNLDVDEPVVKALRESVNQEVERMFRLLGLLFPRYDLHSAYFGLQSDNRTVHDNALEFLDNILKPQLRNVLVPLLDSEVSVSERVRLANRLVGAKMETSEQAAAALVASEDPWLKSCGAYAIGTLGLTSLEAELDKYLKHPDPLLRETAGQAKLRLAALSKAARPAGGGGNQD
jgi:HEAT repeat protein